MKLAIMQPYFFPYCGYFQLMAAVDAFVVYDNIKYTKKGWINRNRIQARGAESLISLPLKKDSDFLDIRARQLSAAFDRNKLCNQIAGAYRHAPWYSAVMPVVEDIIQNPNDNLFEYLWQGLIGLRDYFGLSCELIVSSSLPANHALKSQDRVIDICQVMNARTYINPPGGMALYSRQDFVDRGLKLQFIQPQPWDYPHSDAAFIPWLSIIDVMMFNPRDEVVRRLQHGYELI